MRLKLDENLPPDLAEFLRTQGHDALTIWDQSLQGSPDPSVAEVCKREDRVFVTLDLDFADIRAYPPEQYPGLIVLRVANQSRAHVLTVFRRMFPTFQTQTLAGRLWVVDETSLRVHEGETDGTDE